MEEIIDGLRDVHVRRNLRAATGAVSSDFATSADSQTQRRSVRFFMANNSGSDQSPLYKTNAAAENTPDFVANERLPPTRNAAAAFNLEQVDMDAADVSWPIRTLRKVSSRGLRQSRTSTRRCRVGVRPRGHTVVRAVQRELQRSAIAAMAGQARLEVKMLPYIEPFSVGLKPCFY